MTVGTQIAQRDQRKRNTGHAGQIMVVSARMGMRLGKRPEDQRPMRETHPGATTDAENERNGTMNQTTCPARARTVGDDDARSRHEPTTSREALTIVPTHAAETPRIPRECHGRPMLSSGPWTKTVRIGFGSP
jgi:hypothetical protein